ncbi:COQ9 family protein [Niveispirillum fermenti]|uniref:COQ9 family protein n=1 Tax=Niveispirillum fermenti TaxID=1233113 RepID=UPI003A8AC82B
MTDACETSLPDPAADTATAGMTDAVTAGTAGAEGSGGPAPGESDAFADAQAALAARRDGILLAMLPDVAFDGWNRTVMRRGAESAGFHPQEADAAFPGGPVEAACWLSDWADRQMHAALARTDLTALKLRERVALAVRSRLEALAPYREAVRRSSSLLAMPLNAARGPQLLYATVDAVWRGIGDASTDYNFYTKRLLLSGVVAATTLYWLDDQSEGMADTWSFLDRRISDVLALGKGIGRMTGGADRAATILQHVPSRARFMRRLREAAAGAG